MLPCESRFTGLFSASNALRARAADPELALWGAVLAPSRGVTSSVSIGGAGESLEAARLACIGEGIERHRAHPLGADERLSASVAEWPLTDRALPASAWALFHAEQYASAGFPFAPFHAETVCNWSRFRDSATGEALWIPEDIAYLFPSPGDSHRLAPGTSTGLVAGRLAHPLLLRGAQECIERDAVLGAWWGRYPIEEWTSRAAFDSLGRELSRRFERPNLRYRFFHLRSPFSNGAALVTVEGEERQGDLFSAGTACRETLPLAFRKAAIEAVQGRHFVRYLTGSEARPCAGALPTTFEEHAVYYTLHPERRRDTVLASAPLQTDAADARAEGLPELRARLGPARPILFRIMTPPSIAQTMPDWMVLRVVIPGLQPIHGHHALPHLGGQLWGTAPPSAYDSLPPHPMP